MQLRFLRKLMAIGGAMTRNFGLSLVQAGIFLILLALSITMFIHWQRFLGFSVLGEEVVTRESTERTGDRNGPVSSFTSTREIRPGRDAWDLLELFGTLAVPILLLYVGDSLQRRSRDIAETNLREEALQGYLDRISELLLSSEVNSLEKDHPMRDIIQDIMRTRTLTILRSLEGDGERKGSVIRFLADARLVRGYTQIDLSSANLSNTNLIDANIDNVYTRYTNFNSANLAIASFIYSRLSQANFSNANLENAKFHDAALKEPDFSNANLTNAKLLHTDFIKANFNNAINAVTINNFHQASEYNPDLELLSSIQESSHGLDFVLSEGDYPYQLLLWDANKRGKFSVNKFLEIIGHPNYSYPNRHNIQEIPDKEDLKIAFFKELEPKTEEPLIIDGIEYEIIENPPRPYSKPELDYSDDVVIECKIYSKYELFDYFFGYVFCDGGRFEDDNFIDEYSNFAKVVTDNLRNITVFRLGETQVHIYLVGQTKNGNWIIIHTISIET